VASMRAGEKAFVAVDDPAYGYGESGSFSFPSVPGGAKLEYVVELLGWEEVQEVGGVAVSWGWCRGGLAVM
jgi:hypothetical protein